MKIIAGVYQPDEGQILLNGKNVSFPNPGSSLDSGIRIVFQELTGLENLSIGANLFLGREPRKGFLIDSKKINQESEKILTKVGLNRSAQTLLGELSLAERQLVEIGRALSMKVQVLILDEPTSSLTLEESNRLLTLIQELKSEGVSIVYISHRLDEVQAISDRVVALRDGKNAGELAKEAITHESMIKMMVGREVDTSRIQRNAKSGTKALELINISTERFPDCKVNLTIKQGEILGMAGLVGAGRTELARATFGVDPCTGDIAIDGKQTQLRSPHDAIQQGIFLAPEDRRNVGLTLTSTVSDNLTLPNLKTINKWLTHRSKEEEYANEGVTKMGVKTASIDTIIGTLSGGNQQKVVLSRWLMMNPKVLIVDEPTRGIDVGAKAEIYHQLRTLADQGIGIWMISSDMEEILRMSDRVVVMHEGKISGELDGESATEEQIMALAVGNTNATNQQNGVSQS